MALSFGVFADGRMALLFVVLFQPSYCWSIGNLHWPYISEVTSDIQFGFVSFFHYMNAVALSLYTEYMLKSWGPANTFYYYAFLNFLGYFFVASCMRETYGRSDKEKKGLYKDDGGREENCEFERIQ